MKDEYIDNLEDALSKFMKPINDIPFEIVIKSVYGNRVKKFDLSTEKNQDLLNKLEEAAEIAVEKATEEEIFRSRPNEVGNDMENFVSDALEEVDINAMTPEREDGKKQSTGYPDLYFEDDKNRPVYYEVKTFNRENIDTSQRTFYLSPPNDGKSKITTDAFHLVVSFEIQEDSREGKNRYYPTAWKIIEPYGMPMNVKHEINSSNKELYEESRVISEGEIN